MSKCDLSGLDPEPIGSQVWNLTLQANFSSIKEIDNIFIFEEDIVDTFILICYLKNFFLTWQIFSSILGSLWVQVFYTYYYCLYIWIKLLIEFKILFCELYLRGAEAQMVTW